MKIVNLYRYDETNGIAVTPNIRNDGDTPYAYRLIAESGKILKNGDELTYCIDTKTPDDWTEYEDDSKETSAVEE